MENEIIQPSQCTEQTKVHGPHEWVRAERVYFADEPKHRSVTPEATLACPGLSEDQRRVALRFINEQGVTVGRTVHFVLPRKDANGESIIRPAIIVRVWGPAMVQLQVFFDGTNDNADRGVTYKHDDFRAHMYWYTSVGYDAGEYRRFPYANGGHTRISEDEATADPPYYGGVEYKHVMHYNPQTWHWPPRA